MKMLIALVWVMLAASPLALAQEKAGVDTKKVAPAVSSVAEVDAPKADATKADKLKASKPRKETGARQEANDERKTECRTAAADRKGDARRKFMASCRTNKEKAQKEKNRSCDMAARGKKGAERKAFLRDCLSTKKQIPRGALPGARVRGILETAWPFSMA